MSTQIELEQYRQEAKEWIREHLEPTGPEVPDQRGRSAEGQSKDTLAPERALQRKIYEAGYAGFTWPKEYGGQGLSFDHELIFQQETANYRLPQLGHAGGITYGVCGLAMLQHASSEFLNRHVPAMLAGDELFVQLFSEPSGGSDMAGALTRAVRDGDHWILTGSKIWTSGADAADYGMCLARTDWDAPKHRGLTWFAVRLDSPGMTVQPIREINGGAHFCQEFLDEVIVPAEDVIGNVNEGWGVAQTMLILERSAGRGNSLVEPDIDHGFDPAVLEVARQAGRTADPVARQLLAQIHIQDWVRVHLGRRVTQLLARNDKAPIGVAALWKLCAGTVDPQRARWVIELGHGMPLAWPPDDVERSLASLNHLNSRVFSIAGGSNEMQRNAIGEHVLGFPREPSFDTNRPFSEVVRSAKDWK